MSERMLVGGVAALGVASTLLLSGCTEAAPTIDDNYSYTPGYNGDYGSDGSAEQAPVGGDPMTGVIITITPPANLPNFMPGVIQSTIEELTDLYAGSGTVLNYKGTKVVLTAAHVVGDTSEHCANQQTDYLNNNHPISTGVVKQTPAERVDDDNYHTTTYNGGLDAAVIIPANPSAIKKIPALTVQHEVDLQPGDEVFSVGYGPRPNLDPDPFSDKGYARQPVVVPGYVLSVDLEHNQATFLTGVGGYGVTKDRNIRPGDSGGTLVDGAGNYVGDTIASEGKNNYSAVEIEQTYGVELPLSAKGKYDVAVAQIIDASTLSVLAAKALPCTK